MLNILAAYMQILMDHEAIDVSKSQVASSEVQVEQTQKFLQFGKVAEVSLLQIKSQLAADKLALVNAENQLQLDKITLLQLMEIPATDQFDIERHDLENLLPEVPMPSGDIQRIAESFLPQIRSSSAKREAAEYSLKMAESGWYPRLMMGGALKSGYSSLRSTLTQNTNYLPETIGLVNNQPSQQVIGLVPVTSTSRQYVSINDQFKNNFSQAMSFTLAIPIFNNLSVKSAVANAKINLISAELNEQQVKNDLRKSIETAYTNMLSAGKKLKSTEEQMELEKETYHDMEIKYTIGSLDATSFLIEKNNFTKVALSLIQARYDYVLKAKIIDFYLGKPVIPN
jgi:outer membrane protein